MNLVCCKCEKPYEYEFGTDPEVIIKTLDLGDGNVVHRIRCPHCGLEHFVMWMKIGKW